VQTGFARTGAWFASEHEGVVPDIVTTAKGMGGGLPLGGVTARAEIVDAVHVGGLGGTFGGNPVVCAQGAAVLDVIDREKLQTNALEIGNQIFAGLERLKTKHNLIGDVRGKGLLLGIELVKDRATKEPATSECAHVLESCREMGLLLGKGGLYGQTIRFSPPMCLHEADADFLLDVLDRAFSGV